MSDADKAAKLAEALRLLTDAAHGLSFGSDWNNGTHAKLHGYRERLLDALPIAAQALTEYDAQRSEPGPASGNPTPEQIKHMVDRFLNWRLPKNFRPDGGISFEPIASAGTPYEYRRDPSGTNLFDAEQAEAMVRYMLDGLHDAK